MLTHRQSHLIATTMICIWASPLLGQDSPRYAIVHLPSLGGEDAIAYGVNGRGEVVGRSDDALERLRPVLWPLSGAPVDLGTLGGNFGQANAINDAGTIVGWASLPGGGSFDERAFVYRNGQMEDLGTLGGDQSEASDVDQSGEIVGWSNLIEGGSSTRAVVWRDGQSKSLAILETRGAIASASNDTGGIVGQAISDTFGAWRAVLWQNGQIRDLGTLLNDNTGQSWAYDVNEAGIIVGGAKAGLFHYHAFAWMNGEMYDLSTLPGYGSTHARAINNLNQIVGYATGSEPDQAFLWEPSAGMQRLSALIPPRSSWRLFEAQDINDAGQIVGCGTHRGSEWLLDAYIATPVYPSIEMAAPSPGTAGTSNTIAISGVTPGARIHFLYSKNGGGTRIPGCDLQQNALQLDNPTIIGSAIADANGVASITRNVPLIARGQTILFQAVVQNECAISQLVAHEFQ